MLSPKKIVCFFQLYHFIQATFLHVLIENFMASYFLLGLQQSCFTFKVFSVRSLFPSRYQIIN